MDTEYSSSAISTTFIESLDYLRPPVKKIGELTGSVSNLDTSLDGARLFRHFRAKLSKKTQYSEVKRRNTETSSPLILKRNTDKEISEIHACPRNISISDNQENERKLLTKHILSDINKPVIKVTVIPKTVQTQTSHLYKKRKHITKKVQATVSNHENSIQAKNLFLVVGGQPKDCVYELKRTGSVKLVNTDLQKYHNDEEIPLDRLSSLKLVLDSLNMNKKKEKSGKRSPKKSRGSSPEAVNVSRHLQGNETIRECTCPITAKGEKSCVRITGHLGLADNDRYVLRYAATLDDRPVINDLTETCCSTKRDERRFPNDSVVENCFMKGFARNFRTQRDTKIQTDFSHESSGIADTKSTNARYQECSCCNCADCCFKTTTVCSSAKKRDNDVQVDLPEEKRWIWDQKTLPEVPSKLLKSQISHGTQVNFEIGFITSDNTKTINSMKDESVQCCCTDANTNDTCCKESSSDSEVDNKSLKRCQSPMVVISVYPMQNGENVKVLTKPPIDKKTLWAERSLNINNNNEDQQNNNINKITRESRSANKNPRRFFANKNPGRSRSRSPSPQKEYQIRSNDNDKRVLKSKIDRKISPMRETTVTSNWDNRQVKINQDKLKRNKDRNKTWTRYEKWRINEHKSTNTDYNVTKKLLVENYTKHLTAFMQNNKIKNECTCTRSNDSNVQVNIDGSDQCYDVTLCQGKHITDLKVRKTKKRAADAKGTDKINDSEKNETSSLKNLLLIPECESNGRSISQALSAENQQRNEDTFPRIRIRDSLEIKHRREESRPVNAKNNRTNNNHTQKSPTKHYRGDSCSIPDPTERDQEIRALLGIDKCRENSTNTVYPVNIMNIHPACCFFKSTCDNNSKTSTKISNNQLKRCACSDITIKSSNSIKARNTTLSRLPKMKCACKLSVSKRLEYCKYLNNRTNQQNQDTSPQTESNQKNMQCECSLSTQISSADKKDVQCECNISVSSFHSNKVIEASKKSGYNNDNKATQYEDTPVQHTSLYQQLILNRNIQVFLQVEQFSKQKPIILSRKQYDKVKRTIENTLSNKSKRNKCICKSSLLSLGEVRRKSKRQKSVLDNKEVETQLYGGSSESKTDNSSVKNTKQENTYLLLTREQNTNEKDEETPRQVASKVEFRISSLSYTKYVAFSSTNVEVGSTGSAFDDRPSLSLHTIFKGRRKCTSPNLGTSMCSLNSEEDIGELKSKKHQPINEPKIKKPFLRRLMSCLVMRSARLTEMNAKIKAATRPSNKPSIDSSFDSYHISSSFCGMEMSSSMYDTSISFYTDHSVYPINSKIKRGFFNSVREFLSLRKSQSTKNP